MEYEPLPIISKNFPKVVIPLIDSALDSIDIIVYDWRFYKNDPGSPVSQFNQAIARACQRGVRVRCIVQNDGVVDNLNKMGCWAKKLNTTKILHTKLLIVGKTRVVIGSHNYTQHAFTSNEEASIFVNLSSEQNTLVEYFDNLFSI